MLCAFRLATATEIDNGITGAMTSKALEISSPVGLIAAGGVMPFAVADSLVARGIDPVLFALRGSCDPPRGGAQPAATACQARQPAVRIRL